MQGLLLFAGCRDLLFVSSNILEVQPKLYCSNFGEESSLSLDLHACRGLAECYRWIFVHCISLRIASLQTLPILVTISFVA